MWSRLTVAGVCPLPVSRGGALETRLLWMRKQAPREGEELGLGHTVRQLGQGLWRGASETRTWVRRKFRGQVGRMMRLPARGTWRLQLELGVTVRGRVVTLAGALVMTECLLCARTCGCCLL